MDVLQGFQKYSLQNPRNQGIASTSQADSMPQPPGSRKKYFWNP